MNRKELDTLLQLLKCSNCKEYLIYPPIVQLEDGTSICGNCTSRFSNGHHHTFVRQQALEYVLRKLSFPCMFQLDGCQERLFFDSENHNQKKCVHRPLACPAGRCPWIGYMSDIHKHLAEVHSDKMKSALHFKLLVDKDSEEFMMAVIDKVPFIAKYIYKAEQRKLGFIVSCVTLNDAYYKAWMFNDILTDYGISVGRKKCMKYTSLPCMGLSLNLDRYLPVMENPESVLVKLEVIIEKEDENVAAPAKPAHVPVVDRNVGQLKRLPVTSLLAMPQLCASNKGDVAGPSVPH